MKKLTPFAAALASMVLIAIGSSVPLAGAQAPGTSAKSSVSGMPASPAKTQAQAKPGIDKGDALAPFASVNATALTSAECERLGGAIQAARFLCTASKKFCVTKDSDGKLRGVCINEK
jgi:hypothetical protein